MNFKKIIISLAFVLTLLSVSVCAKTMQFTMGDYDAKVDEGTIKTYTMEVAPYTVEGRTMVPVRIVGETLGAKVGWVAEENKVTVSLGNNNISLVIGEEYADVNGTKVKLDVPSVETNGRTLIPLRFVSETLGFDVKYVSSTQQILITNDPAPVIVNGSKMSLACFDALFDLYNLQYGESYGEDVVANYVQYNLLDYAIYTAEADKWDIELPATYYATVSEGAKELASLFPDVLDAVWAELIEIQERTYVLSDFLAQLYVADEASVEKYYKENYMAAKHILILSESKDAEKTIKEIKRKLTYGGDFDKLMNEYSEDPGLATNPKGYVFTYGEMVEEFETAVSKLKVGKVSDIVETDYGYHIIKRIELPEFDYEMFESLQYNMALDSVAEHYSKIADNATIDTSAYTLEELIMLCR